jgi:hypothetical protein
MNLPWSFFGILTTGYHVKTGTTFDIMSEYYSFSCFALLLAKYRHVVAKFIRDETPALVM